MEPPQLCVGRAGFALARGRVAGRACRHGAGASPATARPLATWVCPLGLAPCPPGVLQRSAGRQRSHRSAASGAKAAATARCCTRAPSAAPLISVVTGASVVEVSVVVCGVVDVSVSVVVLEVFVKVVMVIVTVVLDVSVVVCGVVEEVSVKVVAVVVVVGGGTSSMLQRAPWSPPKP